MTVGGATLAYSVDMPAGGNITDPVDIGPVSGRLEYGKPSTVTISGQLLYSGGAGIGLPSCYYLIDENGHDIEPQWGWYSYS
jgi:hypothetical protein